MNTATVELLDEQVAPFGLFVMGVLDRLATPETPFLPHNVEPRLR